MSVPLLPSHYLFIPVMFHGLKVPCASYLYINWSNFDKALLLSGQAVSGRPVFFHYWATCQTGTDVFLFFPPTNSLFKSLSYSFSQKSQFVNGVSLPSATNYGNYHQLFSAHPLDGPAKRLCINYRSIRFMAALVSFVHFGFAFFLSFFFLPVIW